jgi:hypothetical protein
MCTCRIQLSTVFALYQFLLRPRHITAKHILISLNPSLFAAQYPKAVTTIQPLTASIFVHLSCLSLRSNTTLIKFLAADSLSAAVCHCVVD